MNRDWKLNEEQLQELLLVRKVVISPLIGEQLETEDEASESTRSRRTEEIAKNSEVHKVPRKK
jgi:hypothetical protein